MEKQNLKRMGELANNYRTQMNLTQKQLAERAGVSTYVVAKLEKGEKPIGIHEAIKVSQALNLSTDFLLTGELGLPEIIDLNQRILHFADVDMEKVRNIARSFWETCPAKNKNG